VLIVIWAATELARTIRAATAVFIVERCCSKEKGSEEEGGGKGQTSDGPRVFEGTKPAEAGLFQLRKRTSPASRPQWSLIGSRPSTVALTPMRRSLRTWM
jgi:hypothetical protein